MTKFKVFIREVHQQPYEVEAATEQEALQKVLEGQEEDDGVIICENEFTYVSSLTDFQGKPILVEIMEEVGK